MSELISIVEAAREIRAGRLAPSELLERCLERIGRYEDRVRAWVVVDEGRARETTLELDREAARGGYRGPLHGIPVGVKDIVDVEGLPTRAGSELTGAAAKASDAPLVGALRRAGAVILGKTVTCEFACFDPSVSRNPWGPNLQHTAGGSSSGSAVAVAAGMCLGAIGTQTGGSLVRPASYCGVAALKPTFGRVSTEGVVPVSAELDHPGPMARTVGDLDCMFRCLVGEGDARPGGGGGRPGLGLVEEFFWEEADDSIRVATEAAVDKLREGDAAIRRVELPGSFGAVHEMHRRIMVVGTARVHGGQFGERRQGYGPAIGAMIEEGLATSAAEYEASLAHQERFRREAAALLDGDEPVDALVMAATDTTAPASLETTGDSKFQAPWSYAGLPVVSFPCELAKDGMPAAIQLVGRAGEEGALLRAAGWCEALLGFRDVPPLGRT